MNQLTKDEAIEIAELVTSIGGQKMLRIEQWRDMYGAWRAGIEWYSGYQCEYVTEAPTLVEALRMVKQYMDENPNPEPLTVNPRRAVPLEPRRGTLEEWDRLGLPRESPVISPAKASPRRRARPERQN